MEHEPPPPAVAQHPIQVVVEDDLHRSRLTVFFRLILAIPHFVWYFLWSIGAFFAAIANWFATLITGRSPQPLHDFLGAYVRYSTHLLGYVSLTANPWPGFLGAPGSYPIDIEIPAPERQSRWKTAIRFLLALPALMLASVFAGTPGFGGGGGGGEGADWGGDWGGGWGGFSREGGVIFVVAFFAWFVCLVRGRMPAGFRDLQAFGLRYNAQALGYLLLLTERYPNSDPSMPPALTRPVEPAVRLHISDDLRRSRLTVLFRLLLFLPHLVWYLLWAIAVFVAVIVTWFATLVMGRAPDALHRFISAFVRYAAHISAYLLIIANPFPGFTGAPGIYPIDLDIDPPAPQRRLVTLFRIFLVIPAFIVASALGTALLLAGVFGWFVSLALGRMPEGLRNLGAYCIRYESQMYAYFYLVTERYPYSGPWEFAPEAPPDVEPEVAAA
jgi:uncharacterized protein DUF4389